ncbi:MAG: alpha/beta hydrolase [Chloroflexi bacterium]|nr:alpha/beta hydrolase [Chloroflexota bacterium]
MPLHPQAQAFLEVAEAANALLPPLEERDAAAWRAQGQELAERASHLPFSPPVHSETDRTIPGPAGEIPVRVLTPGPGGDYPVLVWFHGGGWVLGGLDGGIHALRLLANVANCVIVSIDYRLAPEHRFPAAVDDCLAATRWVAEHAAEVGVDPSRIAVGGDSAGGNLAAVVAQLARDGGPDLAFQLLVCPVTDSDFSRKSYISNNEGYLLSTEMMEWFWAQYMGPDGDRTDPRVAPLRAADLGGLPTAHVIAAEYDPLADEAVAYAEAMEAAGVDVTMVMAEGHIHDYVMNLGIIDDAEPAIADVARNMTRAFQLAGSGD